ncbi:rRNA small subunit pseudouridine methyltransferase Nep1 [Nematocida major]|uniref:rRNA small subunit pseudouridine methyltransferase Nep1 n=1 Tax=Nematocida major TaxID=1912982 RepID=UPI00200865A9|nr:rRNA small subunit pseudouridine methyltransferase Nep1 [Nematocida major]KAH9386051.1 rRNA small subunit pseudouridine methyltransferase Nep1 [Nematocida major]
MLTVVLQNANIEIIKTKRGKELMSSEMPETRRRRNSSEYRPDILHQCLLILLDSPLNKSGKLRVLVETTQKKVITINPQTRIPRVYSRFAGLIIQLIERHRIYSEASRVELMKVEKTTLEGNLPNKATRIGLSKEGENFFEYLQQKEAALGRAQKEGEEKAEPEESENVIFYINAVSSGEDPTEGMDQILSLSSYALSAATCCSKICSQFESMLGVF